MSKLKVIITGSTGMVGEGVLHEWLNHPDVERILVINRRPCGYSNPKLTEILHNNFFDLSTIENQLSGYNACFFCLGVSSVGMKEPEFFEKTYTLTMHVAQTLVKHNPDMVFSYISGSGTDSTEKGSRMWARVKGKTENDLMKLPFKKVYAFRPGFMKPIEGLRNTLSFYKYVNWLFPLFKIMLPGFVTTLSQLGLAMIKATSLGYEKNIVEVRDILQLAERK